MNFQSFFTSLFDLFLLKKINKESIVADFADKIKAIFSFIGLILTIIASVVILDEKNRAGFFAALKIQGWLLIPIIIASIFTLLLLVSLLLLLLHLSKISSDKIIEYDIIKYKDNEIVGRLIELEKRIGVEYSDSFKFFQKLIKKYNQALQIPSAGDSNQSNESFSQPYVEFIKDFKMHTNLPLADLTTIFNYASNSSSSIFKCVIAFDEYFEDNPLTQDDEIVRMLRYFCCFKDGAEKNHVNRIFTIPGIPVDRINHIGDTKSIFNIKKNSVILKYLITNKICSIDTYLLVYDNGNEEVKEEFFALADYVIAISANKSSTKENRIFFAYPKGNEPNEKTISTVDPFILALMDTDYEYRLSKLGNSNHLFNIEELKRANKEKIYSSLNFNTTTKEGKQEVNSIIDELEINLIKICKENSIKGFHSEQQIKRLLLGYKLK